jgi:hypothetical protein
MTLPDLRALLAQLTQCSVEHVVIGGIALVLHGGIRTTEDLDVVRTLTGMPDYAALAADAERYEVDGITLMAASPRQLIAMKQVRGSAQDQADIETLRILEARE